MLQPAVSMLRIQSIPVQQLRFRMSSSQVNYVADFVTKQTLTLSSLWQACGDSPSHLPPTVNAARKITNEAKLTSLLDWVGAQLERPVFSKTSRQCFLNEATKRVKEAGSEIFDLTEDQMDSLNKLGIIRSAEAFYHQARGFDPFISFADIYQASRNVWTSNYLQVLLGLPVFLTPSIFAYSMLYPVSDNYLDDPHLDRSEKVAYNQRFRHWLEGDYQEKPQNWNEEDVLHLVRMVEGQYCRKEYPQVYESLLAIHQAQDKSMRLPKAPNFPPTEEVVQLTFEKGGTSVLADGVLAAGQLSPDQMETIFNYGAFAQLMDDQEDIAVDLREGSATLFTGAIRHGKADQTMNRVFNFAHQVLKGLERFNNPKAEALKGISMKGIDLLLIDAVSRAKRYYSRSYLQELENHFPFRFAYLHRVRDIIRKKGITAERLAGLFLDDHEGTGKFSGNPINPMGFPRPLIAVK